MADANAAANQFVAVDDNVLDVDANAHGKLHCVVLMGCLAYRLLYMQGPIDRRNCARKFNEHRIAGNFQQAATVFSRLRLD